MPYTTIDNPAEYFNTVTYTGNGSSLSVTGVGFQSDFRWLKQRSYVGYHQFNDTLRGITKYLFSNATDAEYTDANGFTAIGSDGFTVGTNAGFNTNGGTLVAWNWKANGAGVSNTAGTISSTVSANTTSGFSIVSYTGTGSAATIGHGLGAVPQMIICKSRGGIENWAVYHASVGNNRAMFLNLTNAQSSASNAYWNNTTPTSTLFSVNTATQTNPNATATIAYCFADVKGFSKFGGYTGNGSTDGTFVYTGFKPAFIMAKRTDSTSSWGMFDNKREPFNLNDTRLLANTTGADDTSTDNGIDFLSNGFKWRTASGWNASGGTYIYMCFAENPFTSSKGIACTAR